MKAVIDRFEGGFAVLLAGPEEVAVNFPRRLLPVEAREGDVLEIALQIDREETEARRGRARSLVEGLLARQRTGE